MATQRRIIALGLLVGFLVGSVCCGTLLYTVWFNRTSGIQWKDITPPEQRTAGFVEIQEIEFGVVLPANDPRMQGDSVVIKSFKMRPDTRTPLDAVLAGLPNGSYDIYTRVAVPEGMIKSKWSEPKRVEIDLGPPKPPTNTKGSI